MLPVNLWVMRPMKLRLCLRLSARCCDPSALTIACISLPLVASMNGPDEKALYGSSLRGEVVIIVFYFILRQRP